MNSPRQGKFSDSAGRRRWRTSLADLLVISAISLLLIAPLMLLVHTAEYDEAIFLDVARNIQRLGLPVRSIGTSGVLFLDHTPLYLYLLSLYARQGETGLFLARSVTLLAALAAVALTYRFGVRISGRRTGAIAALLLAINPFFLVYAFFVYMEIFMLLALLAGFYAVVAGIEDEKGAVLWLAGAALAIAVLFKEFALVGAAVAAGYVLWRRRKDFRRGLGGALAVGGPSLLALGGWAAWSWELSPATFAATMNRWLNSAVSPVAAEPRMGLTSTAWAAQLGSQLLGPGLVLGFALGFAQLVSKQRRTRGGLGLLWSYAFAAIALSFATSLKEPRHLIGVLPAVALITGDVLNNIWDARDRLLFAFKRASAKTLALRVQFAAAFGAIVLVFAFAGPVRAPLLPRHSGDTMPWIAPVYAERLANERLYRILALSGERVASATADDEVLTVVHLAPVVAYYADRPYRMLYTLKAARVTEVLQGTDVLVWDAMTFPSLSRDEIDRVQATVAAHFSIEEIVSDERRSVVIYHRKVKP